MSARLPAFFRVLFYELLWGPRGRGKCSEGKAALAPAVVESSGAPMGHWLPSWRSGEQAHVTKDARLAGLSGGGGGGEALAWSCFGGATNTLKDDCGRQRLNFAVQFSLDHLSWQGKKAQEAECSQAECVAGEGIGGCWTPTLRKAQPGAPRSRRELRVGGVTVWERLSPMMKFAPVPPPRSQPRRRCSLSGREAGPRWAGKGGAWRPEGGGGRVTHCSWKSEGQCTVTGMGGDCLTC